MNYFFKFLVPQLLEYFDNDKEKLLEFIPKIALENYKNDINDVIQLEIVNNPALKCKASYKC